MVGDPEKHIAPVPLRQRGMDAECRGPDLVAGRGGRSPGWGTMTQRWLEHTVAEDEAGRTVQEMLTGPMQVSRRMIQKLTRARGILLNRRPAFLGRKVRAGDLIAARVAVDEETGLR